METTRPVPRQTVERAISEQTRWTEEEDITEGTEARLAYYDSLIAHHYPERGHRLRRSAS